MYIRSVLNSFFVLIFVRKNTRKNACTAACTAACTDACTAGGRRRKDTRTRAKRRELNLSSKIPMISKRIAGDGTKSAEIYCQKSRKRETKRKLLVNDKAEDRKKRGSQESRNHLTLNVFLSLKADISAS